MRQTIGFLLLGLFAAGTTSARADFALKDGDVVVFLGDSITAGQTYGRIVENYTLLRFPDRKVRFVNSGWGGDTAAGGLKRLDRDVFAHGATVLVVAYGVNDIGWGTKADAEHEAIYLDAVKGIAEACTAHKVRLFLCSAAITAADPDKAEDDFLQQMCDKGMALARSLGHQSIDVQRSMRAAQRKVLAWNAAQKDEKAKDSLHVADGVHLNELGQRAMAFAIIQGLGAPKDVSAASIDGTEPRVLDARSCSITNVARSGEKLEFDRLDEGLPLNLGIFGGLSYRFLPIPEEIDRYMLTVKGLTEGRYTIHADGRGLGNFTAKQLEAGVNLCSATADGWEPGGPWDAQANLLLRVTDARGELAMSRKMLGHYLPDSASRPEIERQSREINERVEELQRTLTRPTRYHFVIEPAKK